MKSLACVTFCWLFFTASAWAEDDARLAELLQPVIAAHQGTVSVAVKHLKSGATFVHRADEPMPTASLIKFPVMVAAYQQAADGTLDLTKPVVLKEEDKVPGSGVLTQHFSAGTQLSVRDAIRLMIAYSDNTATNLVVDQIGLPATTELMTKWEFPHTRLYAKVYRGDTSIAPERSKQFGLGSTTAGEMLRLLERLHRKELVSAEASQQMVDHLLACDDKQRLAKFLPAGTKVALKTGSVSAVRTVAGIIESPSGPIAVCVLTSNNKDQRWADDNAAQLLCAEIARQLWQHFHPATVPTDANPPTELASGANGELVEALQRTLNQHLGEKSQVSVDGDFGPATKQAVTAFQKTHHLPQTGIVGSETWKSLGPLVMTAEEPPSDPDSINKEVLPLAPADALVGPPFVTADAWAIGDAKTGLLLWHEQGHERRDFASTTKTMTAWLVLREASSDALPSPLAPALRGEGPGVRGSSSGANLLDEILTFSSTADKTPGSTSGLKTGEKLSVRELLYGLMLPSGNDAATALAEHVGPRFKPAGDSKEAARPAARFVAEMNRAASELGMQQTHYANPHGLPDNAHLSTAADQLLLAAKVMQSEKIREYVQTRQHGTRVQGPSGDTRHVVWKNTNKLLEITGYSGLKTGTTDAAGACLVSVGKHSGDELIVVVLGSASNESRYTDTRNLFRWAWQQRGHRE